MGKKKMETASPAMWEQPQELRISLPADSKLKDEIKNLSPSGKVTIQAEGPITGYNMDKSGCSLTIKLVTLDVDGGMGGDVRKQKEYRSGSKREAKEEKDENE